MHKHLTILLSLVALLSLGVLASAQAERNVLRVAYVDNVQSFYPVIATTFADLQVARSVYDKLFVAGPDGPEPALALTLDSNEAQTDWTMTLREGVQWHNGDPFTADDVVHNIERYADPEGGSGVAALFADLQSVEAVDDFTVQMRFSVAQIGLQQRLSSHLMTIFPANVPAEELATNPIGTGAFVFERFEIGQRVVLRANDNYWNPALPIVDGLEVVLIPDANTAFAALSSGEVDIVDLFPTALVPVAEADPNLQIVTQASGSLPIYVMRADTPPFDDLRIREALKLVVDRDQMNTLLAGGVGFITNDQPVPPANPFYNEAVAPRQQDVQRAGELVAEAGYADGLDITLTVSDVFSGAVDGAVALQASAAQAGINIEVETVPASDYWSSHWQQAPFYVTIFATRSNPSDLLNIGFRSGAVFFEGAWENEDRDALIDAGAVEVDPERRAELLDETQALISAEGPYIVPVMAPSLLGARSDVAGLDEQAAYSPVPRFHNVGFAGS
mgnify:CR=1 FL=1